MTPEAHILPAAFNGTTPWAIHSDALSALLATIEAKVKINQLDRPTQTEVDPLARTSHKYAVGADGIATIPLQGVMLSETDWILDYFGIDYTVTPHLATAIMEADARADVRAIVIDADTPGGSVTGLESLHQAIAGAAKPVTVAASGMLCSAGLYVAAAADHIVADPTTIVGSIGTMTTMTDVSAMLKKFGVDVHLIASGPQKGTGTPGVPITEERKRPMQAIVNELAAQFKAAVVRGRSLDAAAVDRLATGEAWLATAAREHGLIDAIHSNPLAAASTNAKESLMLTKDQYKALIAAHSYHVVLIDQLDTAGKSEGEIAAAIKDATHQATAEQVTKLEAKLADQATAHGEALKAEQDAHAATKAKLTALEAKLKGVPEHQPVGGGNPPTATDEADKTAEEIAAMSPVEQARHYKAVAEKAVAEKAAKSAKK